jgi:hypothetical protein
MHNLKLVVVVGLTRFGRKLQLVEQNYLQLIENYSTEQFDVFLVVPRLGTSSSTELKVS